MKKRILSFLMSLCLIMTLLPVATYAAEEGSEAAIDETNYDTLQEAINSAQDGDTILILRDISLTKDALVTIASDTPKEITIDLNQKTISYPNDDEWGTAALTISKPITLNIKNGKIDVGDENHTAIKITCAEETPVDLTLSGVTIQAGYAAIYTDIGNAAGKNRIMLENVDITSHEYGFNVSDADITFKRGSIHTTDDETFSLSRCSLTIDDGEFITTDDTCMDLWDEDTVVINGGYFKSSDDNALYLSSDSKATINGGIFEAPDKAISADAENVTLGENLKTVLQDGTTLEDFLNSTYVSVVKTTATVTFISDGQKVAEVLVRKGQSISGDDLADQSMPADPTKERYIFKGWWTGENGTGEAFTDISIVTNDLTVYAKMDEVGGSLTISKKVTGTGTPDADTLFEFTVTKDKTAAVGQYSVDGGTAQTISADGKISIKAGQSAVLTGLEPGEYTVTETSPTQANYKSTSFSVNNGEVQNGLSAMVTVTGAAAAAGGWSKKDGKPVQDADGYFTYTITSDQIDADGKITVDCDLLAEYMEAQMQEYLNLSPRNFKVKFVNQTGAPIQYQDYRFDTVNWIPVGQTYTPSDTPSMENQFGFGWGDVWQQVYPFVAGQTETAGSLDVKGFDGNNIRLAISPLRCINPAVISYFDSNPGKTENLTDKTSVSTAGYITLKQMNALPELIKKAFTFKNWEGNEINLEADANRTYADFICAFYGVNSLNDLTIAQKYNVLGTGGKGSPSLQESKYKGQSAITTYYSIVAPMTNRYIPSSDLGNDTLNYFKTWGFGKVSDEDGYDYKPDFFLMENDPEVLKMAYDFLYSRCIRFSLDSNDRPVSTSIDNSATSNDGVGGIKDYMDRTDAATANVLKAMNNGAAIADGSSITLDNVKGYIEVPNAWNQFRAYDFGFKLIFKADAQQPAAASVAFTNTYENNDTPTPPTPPTPGKDTGSLTVSKVVAGNAGSQTADFHFTVMLSDVSINGSYGDMTFADGAATFTLKHNEQKTASGLPAGITYTVTESEANQDGYTTTVDGASGSIGKDQTATAAFTNTKNSSGGGSDDDDAYGSLTVSKTISGDTIDTERAFTFTIKLDRSISGTYGDMRFDKGVAVITLKHGESSTATRLPAGTHYTVTESDHDGYTAMADGDTGVIRDGKTAVAAFTNTKDSNIPDKPGNPDQPNNPDKPTTPDQPDTPNQPTAPVQPSNPGTPDHTPKTDDTMNLTLWISLMGFSLAGLFISLYVVKKNSYHGKRVK